MEGKRPPALWRSHAVLQLNQNVSFFIGVESYVRWSIIGMLVCHPNFVDIIKN